MIRAEGLCKAFAGRPVLQELSFTLDDGALVVLTGPSGSGKTTLLRILAGLDLPDRGVVKMDGKVVSDPRTGLAPHRRDIGFCFQSPALWPHMAIAENIAFTLSGGSREAREQRVHAVLEAVGIADLVRRLPGEISFGQARRAALARAIAPRPRYIFLDEPLTNLDRKARNSLLDLVQAQRADYGAAVLFVTHDQEDIQRLGGQQLYLVDGRLLGAVPPP